jgi:hypothetical protein
MSKTDGLGVVRIKRHYLKKLLEAYGKIVLVDVIESEPPKQRIQRVAVYRTRMRKKN